MPINYNNMTWPKILHWPTSPHKSSRNPAVRAEDFLFKPVVITEKLDGSNTMLYNGEIYSRNSTAPARQAYNAMVLKHHAWKTTGEYRDYYIFGENTYAIHSIRYGQQDAVDTFRLFAIVQAMRGLMSWRSTIEIAAELAIPTVPVLYEAIFTSKNEISELLAKLHDEPSVLGGDREGLVIRTTEEAYNFQRNINTSMAKSVRKDHVKPDAEHWSRTWERADVKY